MCCVLICISRSSLTVLAFGSNERISLSWSFILINSCAGSQILGLVTVLTVFKRAKYLEKKRVF